MKSPALFASFAFALSLVATPVFAADAPSTAITTKTAETKACCKKHGSDSTAMTKDHCAKHGADHAKCDRDSADCAQCGKCGHKDAACVGCEKCEACAKQACCGKHGDKGSCKQGDCTKASCDRK